MTLALRRLFLVLTAVPVLAACSERGPTVPAAEVSASSDPSPGVPPGEASDCSTLNAVSTFPPTQGDGSSTTGTGILQGHLYGVGGPAPGLRKVWAGTVTITGSTVHREITVGPDGAYAVALPAGQYDIAGRSPHFGGCTYPCYAPKHDSHRVLAGDTTTLDTYCVMS